MIRSQQKRRDSKSTTTVKQSTRKVQRSSSEKQIRKIANNNTKYLVETSPALQATAATVTTRSPPVCWAKRNVVPLEFHPKPWETALSAVSNFHNYLPEASGDVISRYPEWL